RVRLLDAQLPTVSDDCSNFRRRLRAAWKMAAAAMVVLVGAVVAAGWAAPQQACSACPALNWNKEARNPGVYTESKSINGDGCAKLTVKCAGNSESAMTFVEFNKGDLGGIQENGSQSVVLVCGSDMLWHYQAEGIAPSITALSCSAVKSG
ncbi:hypothetical protein PFISCL1PPCAC_22451, partial [Pristionchus fissidentatus]